MVSFEDEHAAVAMGTGFVVDKQRGLILTNRHITGVGPVRAIAMFDRHEELDAEVIYRDPVHDFGFFRYDPSKLRLTEPAEIRLAPQELRVGTEVRVVGNDAGEKLQILSGTIARVDRNVPEINAVYCDENTFYAGAGAGTSGGSSGSPVLNKQGNAIALNAAGTDGAASAFFLPLSRVKVALHRLQEGLPVMRGTCQATFLFKAFDELRRIGLLEEHEQDVRKQVAAATGMLVVDSVLCEQKQLRPGDILLLLENRHCVDFVHLEEVLDDKVGCAVDVLVCRGWDAQGGVVLLHTCCWCRCARVVGGVEVAMSIDVHDLHSLIPRSYVELGMDVVHGLGYHAARRSHLPLDSGIYLARSGYVFESLGCDWGSLITSVPWQTSDYTNYSYFVLIKMWHPTHDQTAVCIVWTVYCLGNTPIHAASPRAHPSLARAPPSGFVEGYLCSVCLFQQIKISSNFQARPSTEWHVSIEFDDV